MHGEDQMLDSSFVIGGDLSSAGSASPTMRLPGPSRWMPPPEVTVQPRQQKEKEEK
jgi:hypothetical protein